MTLYSYLPALLDQTISIAWELVRKVNASVTIDLLQSREGNTDHDIRNLIAYNEIGNDMIES